MSIADQLTQLNQVKSEIKQALIDKGVDMTGVPFTGYAKKLTEMSGLTPSVISRVKNCRLLFPYTSDTIDNSLYSVPLSTNGATLTQDGATFADGKYVGIESALDDYLTSYNTTQPYTFEIILTLSSTSKSNYIINALTNGGSYLMVKDNKLIYRNVGNTTELISIPYTYTTKKHIALVYDGTTIKLYLDGVEKGSTTTKNAAKSKGYCLLGYSESGYSISGTCGGVRLTSKALSPAEFSDRPMKLWENIDFTEGERTYLFKDGVLDPRINLPSGITNNGEYLVNSGGNVVMPFNIPEVIGKKLFIKCMHTGNLATNQYFLIWEQGIPQQKYIKCVFDGGNILNQLVFLGYDYSNSPETATEQISFTGNANTMRIYEIWYE